MRVSKLKPFSGEIARRYRGGESAQSLALQFGVSREYMRQFLKKAGVHRRTTGLFYLTVCTETGKKHYGDYHTVKDAVDYFFNGVAPDPGILGFSVHRRDDPEVRKIWQNVLLRDGKFERLGAPVYGYGNLEEARQTALAVPLPEAAGELAARLGNTEDVRETLRDAVVRHTGPGEYTVKFKETKDSALIEHLLS